jgi:hypothetical protein
MDKSLVTDLRAYRSKAMSELEEKSILDAQLHAEMADLKRRIDHASELLRLEVGEATADEVAPVGTAPVLLHPISAGAGSQLADQAYAILAEQKRPMHYRELTRALQDRGVVIGGREPSNNVIAAMTRDQRFYRPRRGTYFLRELAKGPIKHVGVRHRRGA